jgi:hypothetical protein
MVVVWTGIVNKGGGCEQRVEVVYDAQIERQQMPTLNLGSTNWIPFRLLVRAQYLYIYIPNSIIFLNTSDSIRLQWSSMYDSDGV